MAKFHVRDTFEIPDRRLFAMSGSIVEGQIRPGMFLRVALNSAFDMTARIHSIEFARRRSGDDDVRLCFEAEPEMLDIWRGLDIGDETFEVTAHGSE